jgi:hypothetical protein
MKRKNLTAAVLAGLVGAAGIAGSAQAVNQNPDGLGQVLIYPYYTTNGGNQTLLSVVNTTDQAKAVKVRFLESENSAEVLDFNLYMSAYDVWVAAIADVEGTPTLFIPDSSCTVPYLYGDGPLGVQPFLDFNYREDNGSTGIARANTGHFEMIEMGTLHNLDKGSAAAATHTSAGVPANCAQLVAAWTDPDTNTPLDEGYWLNQSIGQGPLLDISAPSGGLFGGAAVVNSTAGTMYSYDAKALNGFSDSRLGDIGGLHSPPGNELPDLNSGDQNTGYIFLDDGNISSWSFENGVDAVSYVFMHDAIMNEYNTEALLDANSEWVITFPTKRFYVFESATPGIDTAPRDPFTDEWGTGDSAGSYDACEAVVLDRVWDREEQDAQGPGGGPIPPVVSPSDPNDLPTATPFSLCYETNVIRFGAQPDGLAATEILGATNWVNIDNEELGFENGWVRIDMRNTPVDLIPQGGDGIFDGVSPRQSLGNLGGLPVTGFWVERFVNNNVGDGIKANYGGIFGHKGTRLFTECDGTGCSSIL